MWVNLHADKGSKFKAFYSVSGDFHFQSFSEGMGDLLQGGQLDILCMVFDPRDSGLLGLQPLGKLFLC